GGGRGWGVRVRGTEPTTWPSRRITYLSGGGPVAGRDQRNATELVVDGPAVKPAGRSSGGLFHGAQISRPASRPSTTTAATAITGTAHARRLRGGAAADGAAAGGMAAGGAAAGGSAGGGRVAGGGSAGCSDVAGGRAPGWSVAAIPPSDTWAVQSVPSQ